MSTRFCTPAAGIAGLLVTALVVHLSTGTTTGNSDESASTNEFEGVISYRIEARLLSSDIPPEREDAFGSAVDLYYKNGDYKRIYENGAIDTVWFRTVTNQEYTLLRGESILRVGDASKEFKTLASVEELDVNDEILGLSVKLVVLQFADRSSSRFWYSPEIRVDPSHFREMRIGHQNAFYEKARSLPLRYEHRSSAVIVSYVAVKIQDMRVPDDAFEPPPLPHKRW